jgi:hypothetical protein
MSAPGEILANLLREADLSRQESAVEILEIRGRIDSIARHLSNRACVRLLMSCLLAKLDRPEIDLRKPYTEIGGIDSFSGRYYDENYLTAFINQNHLPCNSTTAFLTPALRNMDRPLLLDTVIVGRPRQLYADTLRTLDDVHSGRVPPEFVLKEVIRVLLQMRDEQAARIASLADGLRNNVDALPLSSEAILLLIQQHFECKNASRLPVLAIAAAYSTAADRLGEHALPLRAHNAADTQTGSLGDLEITLVSDSRVRTVYEMKTRRVTIDDVDAAIEKIHRAPDRIDNYLFVTTDVIEESVAKYASTQYESTAGIEFAILDCLSFLRHFLHLFHRLRASFLDSYQNRVLAEPNSAVRPALKEAFLALRRAAESGE